jgi:hypothetical protein
MPWKISDVDSHKKGLTSEQKKKWVATANGVLADCKSKGEDDCEGKAIRIANGTVKVNMEISVNFTQSAYIPKIREYSGKQYYVVPVVMMVEGVHNGSAGPIYHSIEVLSECVADWEFKPVTIHHPTNDDGEFISVQEEGILENWSVGFVSNAQIEDNKLKALAYLDIQKLSILSDETLSNIQNGKIMEVSVGIFTDNDEIEGEWNGEHYTAIAKKHRPDHLALLPGETGACSVKDGCGVRVNQQISNNNEKKKGEKNEMKLEINKDFVYDLAEKGLTLVPISVNLITNKDGLLSTLNKVYEVLRGMGDDHTYYFLEEIFDDALIYGKSIEGNSNLFKQTYQVNADGSIELTGTPIKVNRKVDYEVISTNSKNKKDMCDKCPDKAKALVNNERTNFDDSDLSWLSELTEDKLDKLFPKLAVNTNTTPTIEEAWNIVKTGYKNLEDYTKMLPDDIRGQIETGLQVFQNVRTDVIKSIVDNTEEGVWKNEDLEKMPLDVLQKIEKSVVKKNNTVADYSVMGTHGSHEKEGKIEPMPLPGVKFEN